ncbi:MAG: glucose-6-phosphate 1-epimerase [Arenicella sp.]|jgi:glucose-6-phosphate 1-epimerase
MSLKVKAMPAILNTEIEPIEMRTDKGASAVISLYGGHLLSWKPLPLGEEQLYLSKTAVLDGSAAIRGGVPVLFPHFGAQKNSPNHGFARLNNWLCVARVRGQNSDTITLELSASVETKRIWPAEFNLRLTVTLLDSSIQLAYQVTNSDDKEFSFSGGLHTYLATADISKTYIAGLEECAYIENGKRDLQRQVLVEISGETDRVYFTGDKRKPLLLISPAQRILIESSGFTQTVVWNPWVEGAKQFNDMQDQDYLNMLCVESVLASQKICLQPGQSWCGWQSLEYQIEGAEDEK